MENNPFPDQQASHSILPSKHYLLLLLAFIGLCRVKLKLLIIFSCPIPFQPNLFFSLPLYLFNKYLLITYSVPGPTQITGISAKGTIDQQNLGVTLNFSLSLSSQVLSTTKASQANLSKVSYSFAPLQSHCLCLSRSPH